MVQLELAEAVEQIELPRQIVGVIGGSDTGLHEAVVGASLLIEDGLFVIASAEAEA